jgi:hypothetical protein
MAWAVFWAIFSQSHLATLSGTDKYVCNVGKQSPVLETKLISGTCKADLS